MAKTLSCLIVVLFRFAALARLHGAVACELKVEAICEANGAGVHCNPCSAASYIECVSEHHGTAHPCPEGLLWDAYSSRCVAASSNPSPCVAGVNVNPPQAASIQSLRDASTSDSIVGQLPGAQRSQQQGWLDWAISSVSSLASSATAASAEISKAFPAALNALLLSTRDPAGPATSSLRSQMLGAPTLEQLQQLQANLAKAADMHSHAVSMSQDASLAESVAAKDLAAAKTLLLGPAGSSSTDAAALAAAVNGARELIRRAAAALKTADDMRLAADDLMSQSGAEAAGVSSAVSAATQQQQQQTANHSTAYAPTFLGSIVSSDAAPESPDSHVSSIYTSEYKYLDDSVNDGYDSDVGEPSMAPDREYSPYWPAVDDARGYQGEYNYLVDDDEDDNDGYDIHNVGHDDEYFGDFVSGAQSLVPLLKERAALLARLEALQSARMFGDWGSDYDKYVLQLSTTPTSSSSSSSSDEFVDLFSDDDVDGQLNNGENSASSSSSSSSQPSGTTGVPEFEDAQVVKDLDNALLQIEQQQQQQQDSVDVPQPAGLMLPEVAQRWQQRSRKGMSGRSHISAAPAAAAAAVAKRRSV